MQPLRACRVESLLTRCRIEIDDRGRGRAGEPVPLDCCQGWKRVQDRLRPSSLLHVFGIREALS